MKRRASWKIVCGVVLFAGLGFLAGRLLFQDLGKASLFGDEAIHARVALEAATAKTWLPLTYQGRPYLAKPPLKILAEAWIFEHFGPTEWNARVLDASCGIATVLLVFVFGALVWNLRVGTVGALVLLGANHYVLRHGVREGVQDGPLVFFVGLALTLYFCHVEAGRVRWGLLLASAVAAASATLTKGAAALVVIAPATVVFELLLAKGEDDGARVWMRGRDLAVLNGAVVLSLVGWVWATYAWVGKAAFSARYRDFVVRATTGLDPSHVHGAGFYPSVLWEDFGLWLLALIPFFVGSLRRVGDGETEHRGEKLVVLWALVGVGLPSLSTSKLPWYIYSAYPAVALMVAAGIDRLFRPALRRPVVAAALGFLVLWGLHVRYRRLEERVEAKRVVVKAERLAGLVEETSGMQLAVRPGTRLRGWEAFYFLPPVGPAISWEDLDRTGASGCRLVVQSSPEAPAWFEGEPWLVPLRTDPREGAQLYVVDLDHCVPAWI